MNYENLIWGASLFAGAFLLFLLEVLIPSGGIIGLVSLAVAIAGVVAFWNADPVWGVSSLLALVVLVPLLINFALKVFPHTPIGKHLILGGEEGGDEDEQLGAEAAAREREEKARAEALVGLEGSASTDLRPIGTADFEGRAVEVTAESGFIERGERVRITKVSGKTVKVRRV
jgi:membrane-bound ClpP family serine protease